MCYLLAWVCIFVAIYLCVKGVTAFIAFLIAAVLFGFFGMIFEMFVKNLNCRVKALIETLSEMSPEQLKEVL